MTPALAEAVPVQVQWRQQPDANGVVADALEVAALVIGHIQRSKDAPVVHAPAIDNLRPTAQAAEPVSFQPSGKRIAAIQWLDTDGAHLQAVTEDGEVLELKRPCARRGPGSFGDMDNNNDIKPVPRKRAAAKVRLRAGRGGLHRRTGDELLDPTEGLDKYGEVTWWGVSGDATIGTMQFEPDGDTVLLLRLSGEEKDERFVDQLRPTLALAAQQDLKVRTALFAENMSGTRTVRASDQLPQPNEREDMVLLDEWIEAGWVRNIIARGGDRIARDVLPGETLLRKWKEAGIGVWFSEHGRKMNYAYDSGDKILVRMMMMLSASERDAIVRRLQSAQLNKGPLAGNGHLGPVPYGFYRDRTRKLRPDPEQWPWIKRIFELADFGDCNSDSGLSTRKLAEALAEEGLDFSPDRLRKILKDERYVTGAYTCNVRGVKVEQNPIELDDPIPIDRFQRIQTNFGVRKGASSSTPLGEFLFNTVPVYHAQCQHETNRKGQIPLLKGRMRGLDDERRLYRHEFFTPEQCKGTGRGQLGGFAWPRDMLERPVVEQVRQLVEHPEVLKQLQEAARHTVNDSSARLTEEQRQTLERQVEKLELAKDAALDKWISECTAATFSTEGWNKIESKFDAQIGALQARLDNDAAAAVIEATGHGTKYERRTQAFLEIMTVETPTDPLMRQLRARLFQTIVHQIIVDDNGVDPITVTIEGHLVPDGTPLAAGNPILTAGGLLDAYLAQQDGLPAKGHRELDEVDRVQTDLSGLSDKAVWTAIATLPQMSTNEQIERLRGEDLASTRWMVRAHSRGKTGAPAWAASLTVHIPTVAAPAVPARKTNDADPLQASGKRACRDGAAKQPATPPNQTNQGGRHDEHTTTE